MKRCDFLPLIVGLGVVLAFGPARAQTRSPKQDQPVTPAGAEFFEKNIRPVLLDRCYKCHSNQSEKVKGGLLLDSREGLLKGGTSGPVIVPGDPEKSLLITAIRYHDPDLQMPPKDQLTREQVAAFEQWVKMGAPDPRTEVAMGATVRTTPSAPSTQPAYNFQQARKFWSFQPLKDPPVPAVKNEAWAISAVDRFLLNTMESKGLTPATPADKRQLIRRATFDLTGLPPTPDEVEAFVNDPSPNAFEKVVDRLLASPAYGERWGRHWLDLVRYADTAGCNSDYPVPSAYRYRNYVIDAFNHDKPYDQFLREQLAGDLLPHSSVEQRNEQIIATGYLAMARRFGSRASEFHQSIEDIIDNVGKTMQGLSISCARCHDHKFDPIPQSDYYALYGIFNSTRYAFPGTEIYKHPKDFIPLGSPEDVKKLEEYEDKVGALDDKIEQLTQEMRNAIKPEKKDPKKEEKPAKEIADAKAEKAGAGADDDEAIPPPQVPALRPADAPPLAEQKRPPPTTRRTVAEVKADLLDAQQALRRLEFKPTDVAKAYAVTEGLCQNAKVHRKGDRGNLGDEIPRGYLTVLNIGPFRDLKGSGRLELANVIADAKNPLTARVVANRIWQYHFGHGNVQTPNDFGSRGKPPTHPELLDYLASRFIESGWSVKKMHRLIMLSRAYQMSSQDDPADSAIDANNEYLWHFGPRRLSAEEIRDSMLFVSGSLDTTPADQPHPFPPENEWKYTQHKQFIGAPALYDHKKRSVYLMQQRIRKHPFLEIFDGADTNATTPDRAISITPLQALFVMNSPLAHELADAFAVRVSLAYGDEAERIDYAYRLAYARPATPDELQLARDYLNDCRTKLQEAGIPRDRQTRTAMASYLRMMFGSNEFFFVD